MATVTRTRLAFLIPSMLSCKSCHCGRPRSPMKRPFRTSAAAAGQQDHRGHGEGQQLGLVKPSVHAQPRPSDAVIQAPMPKKTRMTPGRMNSAQTAGPDPTRNQIRTGLKSMAIPPSASWRVLDSAGNQDDLTRNGGPFIQVLFAEEKSRRNGEPAAPRGIADSTLQGTTGSGSPGSGLSRSSTSWMNCGFADVVLGADVVALPGDLVVDERGEDDHRQVP
jgi:hypothetical protein